MLNLSIFLIDPHSRHVENVEGSEMLSNLPKFIWLVKYLPEFK